MKNSVIFWMILLGLSLVGMYLVAPNGQAPAEAQTATGSGFGSCHTPGPIIIGDKSHNKKSFLVATEDSEVMDATGLHCESSIPKVVAQLRCCKAAG